jgi:ubiquitin-protein ligase
MSVRDQRLRSEYERVKIVLDKHDYISVREVLGSPPDRYIVDYRIKSLVEDHGVVSERYDHTIEVTLGRDYPKQRARCVMLTPVFHPNIDHLAICTEDIGAAGQTLDRTLIFIAQMLAFQAYNLQAPRNGEAARWVMEHAAELPLQATDFFPHTIWNLELEARAAAAAAHTSDGQSLGRACANCGAISAPVIECKNGHASCADCALPCVVCGRSVCLACGVDVCGQCSALQCAQCASRRGSGAHCPVCDGTLQPAAASQAVG